MYLYFAVAGGLAIILAVAHSVPGELLLIRRLNKESLPPLAPFSLIEVRKWGLVGSGDAAKDTLRFSWHLPSVFAVGFGAILRSEARRVGKGRACGWCGSSRR